MAALTPAPAGLDDGEASTRVTAWPFIDSRWAQANPAGPAPTTAMRLPVGAPRS